LTGRHESVGGGRRGRLWFRQLFFEQLIFRAQVRESSGVQGEGIGFLGLLGELAIKLRQRLLGVLRSFRIRGGNWRGPRFGLVHGDL